MVDSEDYFLVYKNTTMNHSVKIPIVIILLINLTLCLSSCKPKPRLPVITTSNVTGITQTTATAGGNLTSDGNADITARGVCWGASQNPTTSSSKTNDGTGIGTFISSITGLTPGTNYYVRAYATNSEGTAYGNEIPFTTDQLKDIDGNVYNSITIGTQVWMVENLKTTKYNNNTLIANVPDMNIWAALSTGAYCWFINDTTLKDTYGALYNWYAVNTGNLCPTGWHVPSDAEWTILTDYLGGISIAGGKLKEAGTAHWISPNEGATNESGFTALPSGLRHFYNSGSRFEDLHILSLWWSSSTIIGDSTWCRWVTYSGTEVDYGLFNNHNGSSVRCLKDQ
jgi:uncharacterized protein (TIGR02145 family)